MNILSKNDYYYINVSQTFQYIYNYIHITDVSPLIKKLDQVERFLLTEIILKTYGSDESKETDFLLQNLELLEDELDIRISYVDGLLTDQFYLKLYDQLDNRVISQDIKLFFGDSELVELSKSEAIVNLREEKLDNLFGS